MSIIESGYKDGVSDLSNKEAFEKLKNQYQKIPIKKKDDKASNNESSDGEYFVPYLSLFSKEFVENSLSGVNYKPKYEAELQIFVEIEEDIDKLEFDYDKNLFTLDKISLQDKVKTNGLIYSTDATIKITCLKDLDSDKEIKIYAYQKNSAQPIIDRKLAGKIIILQNDKKIRKEEKFVLVNIGTIVDNVTVKKGEFNDKEKENFYNSFHQALIIPILENSPNDLDLSTNKDFKIGGKYVDNENKINQDIPGFFEDVQKLFFEAQDTNGNLINSKYRSGYFTVFSLGADIHDDSQGQIASEITVDSAGVSRMVFIKNLILFPNRDDCTMNHEGLHGFNVKHTHRDSTPIDDPNYKYVFPIHLTNNIMAYVEIAYSSWRWQWHIINPNIPEK